jgi:hypothetical protein
VYLGVEADSFSLLVISFVFSVCLSHLSWREVVGGQGTCGAMSQSFAELDFDSRTGFLHPALDYLAPDSSHWLVPVFQLARDFLLMAVASPLSSIPVVGIWIPFSFSRCQSPRLDFPSPVIHGEEPLSICFPVFTVPSVARCF